MAINLVNCGKKRPDSARVSTQASLKLERPQPTPGLDVFLLIDESGSMVGPKGSDPQGVRYEAGKYLIQSLLVKRPPPTGPHRLAVVHFATQAQGTDLMEVTPGNAERMSQAVLAPVNINRNYTNFFSALQKVQEIYHQAGSQANPRRLLVIIFTDGQPDDRNHWPLARYFQDLAEKIGIFRPKAEFYVVGFNNPRLGAKNFARVASDWEKLIGKDHVFTINQMSDLYSKYNDTLRQVLELPPVTPEKVEKEKVFEVQPYLDYLEFHIFYDHRLDLAIYRPDDSLLKKTDPGVSLIPGRKYDIFRVENPVPGPWRYKILAGQGQVTVLRNAIPFRLKLVQPGAFWPLGEDLYLQAVFQKENGQEIKELPNYPLGFMARVISPKKKETAVEFPPNLKRGEIYYSGKPVKPTEAGEYDIELTVRGGDRFRTSHTVKTMVQAAAYLEVVNPRPLETLPRSSQLEVEAMLKRENKPADPEKEFLEHPNYLILAKLIKTPEAEASPTIWLNHDESRKGMFSGVLPVRCWTPGHYRLAIQLAGTSRIPLSMAAKAPATQIVDFSVTASWPWSTRLAYLGWVLLIMTFSWLILWTIWILKTPRLIGNLVVESEDGRVRTFPLRKRGFLFPKSIKGIGSDGHKCPMFHFYARAVNDERLRLYVGGWVSCISLGLLKERAYTLRRDTTEEYRNCYRITLN